MGPDLDVATIGSRFGGIPQMLPAPSLPALDLAKLQALLPGAGKSVRRTLLAAGLRRPHVRYAATAEDAGAQMRGGGSSSALPGEGRA